MKMMRILFAFLLFLQCAVSSATCTDKVTAEQRDSAATAVMALLDSGQWTFVPTLVKIGNSDMIDGLSETQNFFTRMGDKMKIFLDFSSGNVVGKGPAVEAGRRLFMNVAPNYRATGAILNTKVKRKANNKNIHVDILYRVGESNVHDLNRQVHLNMDINPMTMQVIAAFDGVSGSSGDTNIFTGTLHSILVED